MELNFTSKCRACLTENDEMISLFEIYEHDLTLAMILQSCMSTQVSEDDGLPSHLCDSCILVLTQFYNFTVVYEESEKQLKSILRRFSRKGLEADNADKVVAEVQFDNYNENTLILTSSNNEQLDNIATIVGLDDDDPVEEGDVITQENLGYYEIKNGNYCVGEKQQNSNNIIINYVKEEATDVMHEFKKEVISTDDLDDSNKSDSNEYLEVRVADVAEVQIKQEQRPPLAKETIGIFEEYETITKYECSICGEAHLYSLSFQQHMALKHNIQDINVKDYAKHVRLKVNRTKIELDFDDATRQDEGNKGKSKYKCKFCDKKFHSIHQLHQHSKIHDMQKKYVCEICGSRFIRKNYLADHMEGHSSEKKHICKYCGKAYRRRTVLRAHKRVHTHPNHYVCELCGRAFTNSSTLKTHRLLIHIKERNFQCVICNLTFPLKSTLNKHVLRHQKRENGEKGFDCIFCEMQYRDKSSLKRHVETKHQGNVQLVSCPECPKKYTSKANLMKHRRKHHSIEIIE